MIFVQAPNGLYQTNPAASLAYANPNTAHNLGVAWCFCAVGSLPAGVTDAQGNTWCLGNADQQNDNSVCVFICPDLKPGTNTVSVTFGTTSGVDVSLHIEEYSYAGPAASVIIQNARSNNASAWGIGGTYLWGTGVPIPNYYVSLAAAVQQSVTVTSFLGLYDGVAPPHGWSGNVRSETEQSQGSTVSGEYSVTTSTQRIFTPSFGIIYPITPGTVTPIVSYIGFMVVEF